MEGEGYFSEVDAEVTGQEFTDGPAILQALGGGDIDVAEAVALADRIVVMAAEPGRVSEVVDVERPRERGDAAFAEHVGRVRELIGAGR